MYIFKRRSKPLIHQVMWRLIIFGFYTKPFNIKTFCLSSVIFSLFCPPSPPSKKKKKKTITESCETNWPLEEKFWKFCFCFDEVKHKWSTDGLVTTETFSQVTKISILWHHWLCSFIIITHTHTHTLQQLIVTQHSYRSATSASVKTVVTVVRGRDRCPDGDLWTL